MNRNTIQKLAKGPRPFSRRRRGSAIFLALFMCIVCLAAAALCIDVAYMQLVQSQLRSATDAAALAGAQGLAEGLSLAEVRKLVRSVAQSNEVAGTPLVLDDADIVFGTAAEDPGNPSGRRVFTPSSSDVNAVRIQGLRTAGSASGPVPLFLGPLWFGSGPFEPSKSSTVSIADRDIVVVVDRSSSMNAEDGGTLPAALVAEYGSDPTYDEDGDGDLRRIEALKIAVGEFRKVIDNMPAVEQLGLVAYDATARTDSNLDTDYVLFDSQIYAMDLGSGTNIGAGIDEALAMLQDLSLIRPQAVPVMIVMTDGQHNGSRDPVTAAQDAMNALSRLTIHTVTFSDDADQARMQSVSSVGKGTHVHATDVSNLVDSFEQMARSAGAVLVE